MTYTVKGFANDELGYFNLSEAAWKSQDVDLVRVNALSKPDIVVQKSTSADIGALYNKTDPRVAQSGLSLTDRSTTPISIHIHKSNWDALPVWHGTEYTNLRDYRVAILNHEFAHALGHNHVKCPCKNPRSCSLESDVRQQPSRDLGGCKPTTSVVFHKNAPSTNTNF